MPNMNCLNLTLILDRQIESKQSESLKVTNRCFTYSTKKYIFIFGSQCYELNTNGITHPNKIGNGPSILKVYTTQRLFNLFINYFRMLSRPEVRL